MSPFEVELFVARVGSGRRAHAHPPGPTCYQVENSPRQLRVVRHCSRYPPGGFVGARKLLTHPLHLLRPRSFGSLLRESFGRRGFPLSPTFRWTSDRTSGLVSASLPRVRPMSLRRTGRACRHAPSSTSREFHRTSSDDAQRAGGDPATLRRLVRPIFRGLSVSEGPTRTAREQRPRNRTGTIPARIG